MSSSTPPDTSLLPPISEPAPVVESSRGGRVSCGFCGSALAANGDVLRLGAEAKEFRDQEDSIAKLKRELETAAVNLATVTRERDEARAKAQESKSDRIKW